MPTTPPAKPPGKKGGGPQRMVRRDLLKFRWSLECPGCGFKVNGDGQPEPGQRLARCGRCKLTLVLGNEPIPTRRPASRTGEGWPPHTLAQRAAASARNNLTIPSANRLQVSFTAPRPRMLARVQCHPHPAPFQIPRLPGQTQAGLEYLPHLVVQDQLGAKHLQRALGEGPVFRLNSQGYFPPGYFPAEVKAGPGLGLGVAHPVVGLEQQGHSQQAGRHAVPVRCPGSRTRRNRRLGTAGPAAMPGDRRSFPAPRGPGTAGPLPKVPSGPIALPAFSALAILVDPKYSRWPGCRHFPADF